MSITFNPGPKIPAFLDREQWGQLELAARATTNTGSGSSSNTERNARVTTGTTASSTSLVRSTNQTGWSAGKDVGIIDWAKPIILHLVLTLRFSTTNAEARVSLGKTTGDGVGDLARKAIGIRMDNAALKGIVHNGTSEAVVDLSTTLTLMTTYRITIKSDGAGNVEWLVDGVSKGSSSAGPAVTGTADESCWQLETANNADVASQSLQVHDVKYYMEQ